MAGRIKKKKEVDSGADARRGERKDRVLQARVPESLYRELAEQALRLRVPVSNLVRNILQDSTRMVGNLVEGGFEIVEALRPRAGARELEAVLGWQPLLANREMPCAHCAKRIPKGGQAFISVGAPGGRNYVICEECKCELQ